MFGNEKRYYQYEFSVAKVWMMLQDFDITIAKKVTL